MMESGLWYDTTYSACVFMSARCKHQRLRHNIHEIELIHPCECHHQHAAWEWDPWEDTQGRHQFPSKEEAEYSATLAFAIAVSVREGPRLHVPRMPPLEACGRRQHWLDFDPRAMRSWAMTALAITLGLPPLHPEERAWLPTEVPPPPQGTLKTSSPPDTPWLARCHLSWRVRPLSPRSASPTGVCSPVLPAWQVTPAGAPWSAPRNSRQGPSGHPVLRTSRLAWGRLAEVRRALAW